MATGNFVCTRCGNANVPPHDQFSEAIEYRRLDSKERLHRKTLRLVCRACVERIKDGASSDALQFELET